MVKEDQCWWRSQSISAVSHPAEALSTLIYKVHSQTRLLPASERSCTFLPFSWMLFHTSHLIKNELKCKGQLRNHLPHEAIYNSWARKSLQGTCSVLVLHSLPRINSKCVLSHLFWELEALSSGSCLLLCLFEPLRTVPSMQWDAWHVLTGCLCKLSYMTVLSCSVICLCSVAQSYLDSLWPYGL